MLMAQSDISFQCGVEVSKNRILVVVFPGSGCEVTKHWIPVGIADLVDGKPG
jgi:hypothetical protein